MGEAVKFAPSNAFTASVIAGTAPGEAIEHFFVKAGDLFRSILHTLLEDMS